MAIVYTNAKAVLTDNGLTTLYTAASDTTSILKSIRVSNVDSTDSAQIATFLVTSAGVSYTLENERTIQADSSDELLKVSNDSFHSAPLVLQETELLKIKKSGSAEINVVASIMEVTDDTIA
tara:strand:- start:1065 stop:1430 length:366 start_codon:yes stop_codon:yes gene_type:complete